MLLCFRVCKHDGERPFLAANLALLALTEMIFPLEAFLWAYLLNELKVFAEVANIGIKAERRVQKHWHIKRVGCCTFFLGLCQSAIASRIGKATVRQLYVEISHAVR